MVVLGINLLYKMVRVTKEKKEKVNREASQLRMTKCSTENTFIDAILDNGQTFTLG